MVEFIQQFLEQAQTKGARSTAMTPMAWLTVILIGGLATAIQCKAPPWLLGWLGVLVSVVVVAFIVAYAYFAVTIPDALRSEKFTLSKLAIEHSSKGDNLAGLIGGETMPRLPPPKDDEDDGEIVQ